MPDSIPHLPNGSIIGNGKYKIVRFIGAGGFGCTYEAEFMMMRTRVAIKEFYVNSMCNRQASGAISLGAVSQTNLIQHLEEKFVREAQNLFGLSHPNIVGVTDVFKEFGTSYYVMDFIDGQSLQDLIDRRGPLPEALMIRYMAQIMDALDYVHNRKMLHLDLKPDNIMIDRNDRAILIDFGVSKQYDEVDGHNTSTILGQTPGFAPIEQMGNNLSNFSAATDIYALGATMHAALSGQTPPSAANLLGGIATLAPLPPQTSMQTRRAIDLMMRPRSADRPQSISAIRALLFSRQQPIQQRPIQRPLRPDVPRPLPDNHTVTADNKHPHSGKGYKIAKSICLGFAILFTVLSVYYFISIFAYDYDSWSYGDQYWEYGESYEDYLETIYGYDFYTYIGTCLLYTALYTILMIPSWILFGVFGKKYHNAKKTGAQ